MLPRKHSAIILFLVTFNLSILPWNEQIIGWQEYIQHNQPRTVVSTVNNNHYLDLRHLKPDDHSADQIRLTSVDLSYLSEAEREKVTTLDLRYHQIKTISGLSLLPNLQVFYLSGNDLEELPEEIGDLKNLMFLDVSFNKLKKLPQVIGKLKKLRQLDLASNQLSTLPPEIGQLSNLAILNLSSDHPFTSLPPTYSKVADLWQFNIPPETKRLQQIYLDNIKRFIIQAIQRSNLVNVRKFTRSIIERCEIDPNSFHNEHGNNLLQLAILHHDSEKDPEGKIIKELMAIIAPYYTDLITLLGKNHNLFVDIAQNFVEKEKADEKE
ncbi:MAG: leucine-rich repeat domain-containing protein [bacterium]|nr:leucine-rich repeat domain-containing protein [bacterium]